MLLCFFILVDNYFRSLYRYDLPVSGKFCTILVTTCRWWFAKLTDLFLQFWNSWPRSTGFAESQFRLFWKESVKNSRRKVVSETRSGSGVPNIWFCGAPRVSRVARGIHLNYLQLRPRALIYYLRSASSFLTITNYRIVQFPGASQ